MLSIIIPTKNEENYLPLLLNSIKEQKYEELEIVVADNNSKDKTKKIAEDYSCRVVEGGLVAKAKNNGAKAAKGDLLFFIDADMILQENSLEKIVREFKKRDLDMAGVLISPTPNKNYLKNNLNKFGYSIMNYSIKLLQYTKNSFTNPPTIVKKEVYERIGGFDESLIFGEDSEITKRVKKYNYKFRILKEPKNILASTRRLDKSPVKFLLVDVGFNIGRFFGYEFRKAGKFLKYDY